VLASIIIVNWNGACLLRQGLPSIIDAVAYTREQHEIIVVDDGSQDDSVIVIQHEFPDVKLVVLKENHGFGKACNIGVEHSSNEIVIMLNSDMIVEKNFIEGLLPVFADDAVFVVACKIKKMDKEAIEIGRTHGKFIFGFITVDRDCDKSVNQAVSTLYASGGAAAYRKKQYMELGGFDELYYPFYWEDLDLSYRAWKRGWKVLYQPRSVVYHKHQGTIGKSFKKSYVKTMYYKNKFIFTWRNITDSNLLIWHIMLLLPCLMLNLMVGRVFHTKGFYLALKKLPNVFFRRKQDELVRMRTDSEVLDGCKKKNREGP